jgi:hypothetical protein
MKIVMTGRRVAGKDPLVFKNPTGEPIFLEDIGCVSQDVPDSLALELCSKYSDILKVWNEKGVEKSVESPENKMIPARKYKKKGVREEEGLVPEF